MKLRRRRVLIDPLQLRLVAQAWVYMAVVLTAVALIVFGPLAIQLGHIDPLDSSAVVISDQFLTLHEMLWPALAVVFLMTAMHSILISHRIVGPLYRLRASMRRLADGEDPGQVRLRRNDCLNREAHELNRIRQRMLSSDPSLLGSVEPIEPETAPHRTSESRPRP